ncbi:hypothetical protein F5I97DRAFT_1925920 [Phlebopus sp. FC_14]|nr:hypothetical protein F5I97DRAFT_1925920 [Phlebopus sp. FC_14]
MPAPPPRVRVVVQLPYNRPENAYPDPPHIEWNAEKANILWEVIALSRTSDNGGTDWKGLAAHLQVPLPYLLYRAQARYEEDLRGLQDIRGVLSGGGGTTPSSAPATIVAPGLTTSPRSIDTPLPPLSSQQPHRNASSHGLAIQIPSTTNKLHGTSLSARRLSASGRLATPLGVRARLNSLTHRSPVKSRSAGAEGKGKGSGLPQGHGKTSSSSIATLQGAKRPAGVPPPRATSPFSRSDESESEEDEEDTAQRKEEEAERAAEEREGLEKKLEQLTRMMTSDRVGLVRSRILAGVDGESRLGDVVRECPSSGVVVDKGRMGGGKGKEREIIRGRPPTMPANANGGARQNLDETPASGPSLPMGAGLGVGFIPDVSTRGRDHSASVSSASSPQGSIPSIPSPPPLSPGPSSPRIRPRQAPPRHSVHSSANSQPRTQETQTRVQSQGQIQNQIQNALSSSPMTRHLSPSKSSSPPAVSVRNARGHTQVQGRVQGYGGGYGMSEGESNHGSSASSFSDLSDASLSASALESALMSNIRGAGGSRL